LKTRKVADFAVKNMVNFVTGANRRDTHLANVNLSRDFEPDEFADLRTAKDGDRCPRCEGNLTLIRGIEVGHVFKLGAKYSAKMDALYLTDKGESKPMIMGCYGIGVNRIMASAIELYHDDAGIIWPLSIAPYQVLIVSLRQDEHAIESAARKLYEDLQKVGVEVLWDDRYLSPGVKFNDADLIGIPVRVTVGNRVVKNNTIDIKSRTSKEQVTVHRSSGVDSVSEALRTYSHDVRDKSS
jgi:prolyl-tRNA synthetase